MFCHFSGKNLETVRGDPMSPGETEGEEGSCDLRKRVAGYSEKLGGEYCNCGGRKWPRDSSGRVKRRHWKLGEEASWQFLVGGALVCSEGIRSSEVLGGWGFCVQRTL